MKKKLTIVFGFCICIVSSLMLLACSPSSKCEGNGVWYYDSEYHWQRCKDEHCPEKVDYGQHNLENNKCTECGFVAVKGLMYKYDATNQVYQIIGCTSDVDSEIVINDYYDDGTNGKHPVAIIKHIDNDGNITKITLPNTITTIDDQAFYWCNNLAEINIPNTVTRIGEYAFYRTKITQISIPNSVTDIGKYAFTECEQLATVTLPNTLTKLPEGIFNACYALNQIEIPNTVTAIEQNAFSGCSVLRNINLPSGLTKIGDDAFSYCFELEAIEIPKTVTSIGKSAFYFCQNLASINIPEGVTEIKDETFKNCENLKTLYFGKNLSKIGAEAFSGYAEDIYFAGTIEKWTQIDGLMSLMRNVGTTHEIKLYFGESSTLMTSIDLSNTSITEIKPYAFYHCDNITSIKLPSTLKTIGTSAFEQDTTQFDVVINFAGTVDQWAQIKGNKYLLGNLTGATLYVENNKTLTNVNLTSTVIEDYAFANSNNLVNITLPENLESVGDCSFRQCVNLNLTQSGNAYYIGSETKNLVLVHGIKDDTVTQCEIDKNCKFILYNAFGGSKITSITITNDVVSIGESAFDCCSKLTYVKISGNNVRIGKGAFSTCHNLTTVVLSGVKVIEDYAFSGNSPTKFFVAGFNYVEINYDTNEKMNENTIYYYSSSRPTTSGNYWHYNTNQEPVSW